MTARQAAIRAISTGDIVSNLVHEESDGWRLHVIFKFEGTKYGYISKPHPQKHRAEIQWHRMLSEAKNSK